MLPRANALTAAEGCDGEQDGPGLVWRVGKAPLRGPFSGDLENGPGGPEPRGKAGRMGVRERKQR